MNVNPFVLVKNLYQIEKMEDASFFVSVYSTIIIVTAILLFTICKYLKEKPYGAQFVTDYLIVDAAITIFCAVSSIGFTVIGREVYGPLNDFGVGIFLSVQQFLNLAVSKHIQSIQAAHFFNIFFAAR